MPFVQSRQLKMTKQIVTCHGNLLREASRSFIIKGSRAFLSSWWSWKKPLIFRFFLQETCIKKSSEVWVFFIGKLIGLFSASWKLGIQPFSYLQRLPVSVPLPNFEHKTSCKRGRCLCLSTCHPPLLPRLPDILRNPPKPSEAKPVKPSAKLLTQVSV